MRIFLDTEFNGFRGELISIALVPESVEHEVFYHILSLPDRIDPWVSENVIPVLYKVSFGVWDQTSTAREDLREQLDDYLSDFYQPEIICDWPSDVEHFIGLMFGDSHAATKYREISFSIVSQRYTSMVPHNALADAIALRDAYTS